MSEFVEKRCEKMIRELEQMERLKLFDQNEIRGIAKKRKQFEYKIQRHTKSKEDYLRYIQYEMDLLKLVKQRRKKLNMVTKNFDIEHTIAKRINKLYVEAIFRFKDDLRFWIAYMKFCKHVHFHRRMTTMIGQMLQIHQDKPKCWHIAARWEMEENKNVQHAREYLLRGLHFHPDSQLLFLDAFELELKQAETDETEAAEPAEQSNTDSAMCLPMKRAIVIYEQAIKRIKDVNFVIKLLNVAKEHQNTENLQNKIIGNMITEYSHRPEMWDTMARRHLEGLPYEIDDDAMETDKSEPSTPRERIQDCNEVYQTAVKKIKSEAMWSLYLECLLEINQDLSTLPNYKRKLLKTALMQAHQAKKLQEKYYFQWIEILKSDKRDENGRKKLEEILNDATEVLPKSVGLWQEKIKHHIQSNQEELAFTEFQKAAKILGGEALPLWRMKLLYVQAKNPAKTEEIFRAALQEDPIISDAMKPAYIEWLLLTKGIQPVRQVYNDLVGQPPFCLELHKKMAALELLQPEVSKTNARRPHEFATLQFGKSNTDVWMDYIFFEMKHGDPMKVADIHRRAVKTLDAALSDTFTTEYSLIKANPESSGSLA